MWPWVIATIAAWQAFTVGPFPRSKSGHVRAIWAAEVAEPVWIAPSFANLALTGYDGETLAGDVDLWAAEGLDPRTCVPEIVWDSRDKHGARVDHPPKLVQGPNHGWRASWHFETAVANAPAVLAATAFVFCPIDADHEQPPWGATFTSIEMVIAGPSAKTAFCKKPLPKGATSPRLRLEGHHSFEIGFACGVLPRTRGHAIVDDCTGNVLLSLDALGKDTYASAPGTGNPLDERELRAFTSGGPACTQFSIRGFDAKNDRAWQLAIQKLGARLVFAASRDDIIFD